MARVQLHVSCSAAAGDSVRKPLFEQFWGSGAPLIGEEGGTGWQDWAISQQALQQQPPLPEEPGTLSLYIILDIPKYEAKELCNVSLR